MQHTDGAGTGSDASPSWDSVFAEGQAFAETLTPDGAGAESAEPQSDLSAGSGDDPHGAPPVSTGDDQITTSPTASQPASSAAPETDPLHGASPFAVTINGQSRTFDGLHRFPGEGLLVPEDRVPWVESQLTRLDELERSAAEYQEQRDEWNRLTAWPTKDASGNAVTLTGRDGLAAQRDVLARTVATLNTMTGVLTDPAKLVDMVTIAPTGRQLEDGSPEYALTVKPGAIDALKREAQLNAREVSLSARDRFAQQAARPAPEPPSIESRAEATIAQVAQSNKLTLSAESRAMLAEQLPLYVRATTPQERQANPSLGPQIVDAKFLSLMQRTAALEAQQQKVAADASKVSKFNGAMNGGRQGAPPKPAPVVPSKQPDTGRAKTRGASANDAWSKLIEEARDAAVA